MFIRNVTFECRFVAHLVNEWNKAKILYEMIDVRVGFVRADFPHDAELEAATMCARHWADEMKADLKIVWYGTEGETLKTESHSYSEE